MKKHARNILSLFAGDAASRLIGFVITVYLARVLEPEGFGLVSMGLAVLGHLQLLASPGIQVIEMRNAARPGGMTPERFGAVLVLRVLLALVFFGAAASVLYLASQDTLVRGVILASILSLFPMAVWTDWYFQGKEMMAPVSLCRVLNGLVYGGVVFLVVLSPRDVVLAPLAFFAGAAVNAAVLFGVLAVRSDLPRFMWHPELLADVIRSNLPVGLAMFAGQMVTNLPPLVIGIVLSAGAAGMYSAAMKLVVLLLVADRILGVVLLPALSRIIVQQPADVGRVLSLTVRVTAMAGVVIAVCGGVLAPALLDLVFGGGYAGGEPVLRILLLYAAITLLNSVATATLIAAGQEKRYGTIMLMGSAVLAGLMILLTPLAGIVGTAIGAVAGELFTVLLMTRQASAVTDFPGMGILFRPLLAAASGILAAALSGGLGPWGSAALTLAVIGAVAAALRILRADELRFIKERLV